jgi:hypothetical protein
MRVDLGGSPHAHGKLRIETAIQPAVGLTSFLQLRDCPRTRKCRIMNKLCLFIASLAVFFAVPVFADVQFVSLHNSLGHMVQTTLLGVNPILLVVGVLLFAATLIYRLRRAR